MLNFDEWSDTDEKEVNGHHLAVLTGRDENMADARNLVAAVVPGHYASEEHIARALERLGKQAAADFIRKKLPTSKSMRSGDLGEIFATEFIAEKTAYDVPIKKLRWKDHRNMALRGDDVIGILLTPEGRLQFLKAESKSRVNLSAAVLEKAREDLDKGASSTQTTSLPSASATRAIDGTRV